MGTQRGVPNSVQEADKCGPVNCPVSSQLGPLAGQWGSTRPTCQWLDWPSQNVWLLNGSRGTRVSVSVSFKQVLINLTN